MERDVSVSPQIAAQLHTAIAHLSTACGGRRMHLVCARRYVRLYISTARCRIRHASSLHHSPRCRRWRRNPHHNVPRSRRPDRWRAPENMSGRSEGTRHHTAGSGHQHTLTPTTSLDCRRARRIPVGQMIDWAQSTTPRHTSRILPSSGREAFR